MKKTDSSVFTTLLEENSTGCAKTLLKLYETDSVTMIAYASQQKGQCLKAINENWQKHMLLRYGLKIEARN